jgi:GxxExxY protein
MTDIQYKEESYKIIGACMKVHKLLGPGFLESVYAQALKREFKQQSVPFEREKKLHVFYEGKQLNKYFRADFVCYNTIIIELKAKAYMVDADKQQTLNNVKATNSKLGLLINFGMPSLFYKRFVNKCNSC